MGDEVFVAASTDRNSISGSREKSPEIKHETVGKTSMTLETRLEILYSSAERIFDCRAGPCNSRKDPIFSS